MRKAMIVWGGWPGHDPDLCAAMIRSWLTQAGFDKLQGALPDCKIEWSPAKE